MELYLLSESLEGLAARLAAERITGTRRSRTAQLLTRHEQRVELQEGVAYFQKEGDLDFHYRIVQASGNARLIQLLCNDLYHLMRMYRYQFGMASSRARNAFREHGHIVEAIADRDGEMAELLMRRHVRVSRENVARQFAEHPDQSPNIRIAG
jgi:DNA-binding GntR family transcriptional regulator